VRTNLRKRYFVISRNIVSGMEEITEQTEITEHTELEIPGFPFRIRMFRYVRLFRNLSSMLQRLPPDEQ
jgi:hypothetical protein